MRVPEDIDLDIVMNAIYDFFQGRSLSYFSNALIEGSDEPMRPIAYALYFPNVAPGMPRYRLLDVQSSTQEIAESKRSEYRQRILEARVPPHKQQLEQSVYDIYVDFTPTEQEELIAELAAEAMGNNLPLFFCMFAVTARGKKPVLAIYYPPALPLITCLELIQNAVRDAMEINP